MRRLFALLALAILATPVWAGDLRIGRATEHGSLDPLYSDLGSDVATADNMFESMVRFDSMLRIQPSLASFVRPVKQAEIVDALTLRIHTVAPTPLLMDMIGRIFVLPAKLGPTVANEDFNSGRALIGTGPYRFKSSAPGDNVVWIAFPDYWGGKPEFDTVTVKFLANPAARSAALLSGAVDVIEQIPPSDIGIFRGRSDLTLYDAVSTRVVYVGMDQGRDNSPFITDKDGNPMNRNPLKDRRVRLALSKLINRQAIVERVLSGAGEASGQIVPDGMGGYDQTLQPVAFDPAGAKQLLIE